MGRHRTMTTGIGALAPGLAMALHLAACDGEESVGPRSNYTATEAAAARQACLFKAETLPGLSLAKDAPLGRQIPIDTIVIIMMENRSFDHLLGDLGRTQPDADVAPPDATNPGTDGTEVARFHMNDYCFDDPKHGWNATHLEWNGGKMDGFVVNNDGASAEGKRAMGYYTAGDAPFIYALANTFAVADRSFSSLLGPTFPNRAFMEAGTSFGMIGNIPASGPHDTVIEMMERGGVTWHDYYAALPTLALFPQSLSGHHDNLSFLPSFVDDVAAGRLAQVNWVDPELGDDFGAVRNDLHPPGDVQLGDLFLENAVKALIAGPQWPHMAIIFTLDEHGGLYDHVPPPPACPPDDLSPKLGADDLPGAFDRLGVRVPTIVISPYAKPHYVSHDVFDHTSILRFIEARFILPSLTSRDANANPFFDLFDFGKPSLLHPPKLPSVVVDEAKKAACNQKYPPPSP